jgi:hypothetical protein
MFEVRCMMFDVMIRNSGLDVERWAFDVFPHYCSRVPRLLIEIL